MWPEQDLPGKNVPGKTCMGVRKTLSVCTTVHPVYFLHAALASKMVLLCRACLSNHIAIIL